MMFRLLSLFLLSSIACSEVVLKPEEDVLYLSPSPHPELYLGEHFDESESYDRRWMRSSSKKDGKEEALSKYDGEWSQESALQDPLPGDKGLVLKSKAKHAAISSLLRKPFTFSKGESDLKPLLLQYELNFQKGQDCGGGYLKLLSHDKAFQQKEFNDKTPYTIMFGPDKCGSDAKLHFIFRHVNPLNGSITEKHAKKLETKERTTFEEYLKDKRPHLYRLIVNPDSTYEISIDYKIVNHGSLLQDFEPPVNPPAEMDDPKDFKPADWDEIEKIPDPEARKPDDWDEDQPRQILDESTYKPDGWLDDEPETIPDPNAEKPDDWDEEMDGEWEAPLVDNPACASAPGCGVWKRPLIDNPLYKGKWRAPLINNPNYRGKWKPRKVKNPDYFHDPEPFSRLAPIGAVGIELWSMSEDIYFDNVLIADNLEIANAWAGETFDLKVQKLDANDAGLFRRILLYSNRNPWLYAVYVVVVGLPLVLIITFCCSGGSSSAAGKSEEQEEEEESSRDPKKTDAVQADDEEEVEEEEEIEELEPEDNDEEPLIERRTSPRKRRARKE